MQRSSLASLVSTRKELSMRCPLCSGQLQDGESQPHLGEAFWMAIEALGTEADMLRLTGDGGAFADDASAQAESLRQFARQRGGREGA
jgi:hypothetical protein